MSSSRRRTRPPILFPRRFRDIRETPPARETTEPLLQKNVKPATQQNEKSGFQAVHADDHRGKNSPRRREISRTGSTGVTAQPTLSTAPLEQPPPAGRETPRNRQVATLQKPRNQAPPTRPRTGHAAGVIGWLHGQVLGTIGPERMLHPLDAVYLRPKQCLIRGNHDGRSPAQSP
jgi:hypothetical protein